MSFLIRPYRRLLLAYLSSFSLLIVFLVLSYGSVYAEWVLLTQTNQEGPAVYADPSTIRREGNLVKMWALYDFKTIRTVEGISYLSYKVHREYDCTEERIRYLAFTFFSGNMGSGKVAPTTSDEQQGWEPVQPDSINQILVKAACAKQ